MFGYSLNYLIDTKEAVIVDVGVAFAQLTNAPNEPSLPLFRGGVHADGGGVDTGWHICLSFSERNLFFYNRNNR